ncbi:hypothetical protein QEN19_003350 [Hanseniaspora menglaensis]
MRPTLIVTKSTSKFWHIHYLLLHVHTHEFAVNFQPNGIQTTGNELQELRCWLYDFMTGCVVGSWWLRHLIIWHCAQSIIYHKDLLLHVHTHEFAVNFQPNGIQTTGNELQELRCWLYDFMTGCVI